MLVPEYGENGQLTGFEGFEYREGQMRNDVLHGFGRTFQSNDFWSMGWFKDGMQHGYAKYMMSDNITWFEGLFENDIYKF